MLTSDKSFCRCCSFSCPCSCSLSVPLYPISLCRHFCSCFLRVLASDKSFCRYCSCSCSCFLSMSVLDKSFCCRCCCSCSCSLIAPASFTSFCRYCSCSWSCFLSMSVSDNSFCRRSSYMVVPRARTPGFCSGGICSAPPPSYITVASVCLPSSSPTSTSICTGSCI